MISKGLKWVLCLLVATAGPLAAEVILDFGVSAPNSGSISFNPSSANPFLIGNNIQVHTLFGGGTPSHTNQTFNCIGCIFSFTSGPLASFSPSPATYYFGGGGNVALTGGIDVDGDGLLTPGVDVLATTLLSGQFDSDGAIVTAFGTIFKIAGGTFSDTIDPALATLFGLPLVTPGGGPAPYEGNFNISFLASGGTGGGFSSSSMGSGDVITHQPEPGTMMLLGSGLLGLAGFGRRRLMRRRESVSSQN